MNRGKAVGEDVIIVCLLMDGESVILEKLGKLYTRYVRTFNVPVVWKNASIILIRKKGGGK